MESRQEGEAQITEVSQFQDFHCPRVVVLWTRRCSALLSKLSFNINREICSYLRDFIPHVLPSIQGSSLRLYDLESGETKQVTLSHSFGTGTMYCVVDDQTVLCIGGHPPVAEVYSLSLSTYELSPLPSMSVALGWSGVLRHGNFIYSFGGYDLSNVLRSCEKYSLLSKSWEVLVDMHYPRHAFSPSEYQGEVYLPDPYQSHKVLESFNLLSEQFRIVPIQLSSFSCEFAVSSIVGGDLIIFTKHQIGRCRIQSAETSFRVSETSTEVTHMVTSCPPVLRGRELHFIIFDSGKLMKLNVETLTITE